MKTSNANENMNTTNIKHQQLKYSLFVYLPTLFALTYSILALSI